jgi:hypothetical protein
MVAATARIGHCVGRASPFHGHEEGDARRPRSVVHGGSGGRGEAGGSGRVEPDALAEVTAHGALNPCTTAEWMDPAARSVILPVCQYTGASGARIHRNRYVILPLYTVVILTNICSSDCIISYCKCFIDVHCCQQ